MIGDCGKVVVHAWADVYNGCEIRYRVSENGRGANFMVGDSADPFEFYFESKALQELMKAGTNALAELATHASQDAATQQDPKE